VKKFGWFDSLPMRWSSRRLKYAAKLGNTRTDGRPDNARYLGLENVESWTGRLLESVTTSGNAEDAVGADSVVNCFDRGDVLFGKLRPYLAKAHLAQQPGVCTTELLVMKPQPEVYGKFLLYSLLNEGFISLVDSSTFGSKMPRADWDFIGGVHVPVPPPAEQRTIAGFLDRETVRLDALVEAKERWLELLAEKRRALITHAVIRGLNPSAPLRHSGIHWLGKIPKHWNLTRLKFVAEVRGGLTLGKKYGVAELNEYPYLRVANVQDGHLNLDDVATVFVPEVEAQSCLLQSGDVLMNEGGDPDKLGRGCVWHGQVQPCLHQNHVFAVRPHKILSEWLDAWTSSEAAKSYFESRAKQTTNLASISGRNIKELPVPLPADEEQRAIVAYIGAATAKLDALRAATERTIALLKERRSALIAAAVTGNIKIPQHA
jgi:type I restriction enzyme S subunit